MSKLNAFLETPQTEFKDPVELLAAIEAEERGENGLCPFVAECYEKLGLTSQHCAWNYDNKRRYVFLQKGQRCRVRRLGRPETEMQSL